jgi:hypothetical protein
MKAIPLSAGRFAQVDDADFDRIAAHRWHVSHNGYAIRRERLPDGRKRVVFMHREIFGGHPDFDIDHADGDRLNNRRANLREATRTQNNANGGFRGGSSAFKGVCWHRQIQRWVAYINVGGKRKHLGSFDHEQAAAEAYNAAATQFFGGFSRLNPI